MDVKNDKNGVRIDGKGSPNRAAEQPKMHFRYASNIGFHE